MAIKGLVDLQAYVIGDYQTPLGYFNPQTSVGDYVLDDFVVTDYLLGSQDLVSTFSLQAEGTVNSIRADLVSIFTVSADGEKFDFASATVSTTSSITVTYTRIRPGTGSYTSSSSASAQGNATYVVDKALTTTTTHSANAIYTSSGTTLELQAFNTQVQLAGKLIQAKIADPTWDEWSESGTIDKSWDDFADLKWDELGTIIAVGSFLKALGGYLAQGTASPTAVTSTATTFTRIRESQVSPTVASTQSANANYTASGDGSHVATFTQPAVYFDRFRGVSSNGNPYNTTAVSTQSANANFVSRSTVVRYTGVYTASANGFVTFDLAYGQDNQSTASLSSNANVTFDLAYGQEYFALGSSVGFGILIVPPDPWNTIHVPLETRTLVVPIDSRVIEVSQETRVNTVGTETRSLKVPQESRSFKIYKPGYTDKTSIPRVRSET